MNSCRCLARYLALPIKDVLNERLELVGFVRTFLLVMVPLEVYEEIAAASQRQISDIPGINIEINNYQIHILFIISKMFHLGAASFSCFSVSVEIRKSLSLTCRHLFRDSSLSAIRLLSSIASCSALIVGSILFFLSLFSLRIWCIKRIYFLKSDKILNLF